MQISLNITYPKFPSNLLGANELTIVNNKLEWAASNGNRYPPYPQLMATAISQ